MPEQIIKQNIGKLVKASARHLHIAPRKMRLATNLMKNMNVGDALTQLNHLDKKASPILIKLLKSAIANAKNNFFLDPERLYIKSITTDMGKVMKRYMARARGSAFTIRRKMCHVNVVLEERKLAKASKSKFSFLKKKTEVQNLDQQGAVNEKPVKEEGRKSQVFKTDEQMKMNKIQQKRRLFNRKSGE
ncbi:MAG: 50S ribosomal protein L22 [Candidatus Doudnabacteria bacterium]|nr:50S ribosomal protein L22 [Candidatus Doudnabacteria bacterium]